MGVLSEKNSILLIIDVQKKLLNAVFNKETIEKKASIMAQACNILGIPVIVTEQYPQGLGSTVSAVENVLPNSARVFEKTSFSALDNPEILKELKSFKRREVVVFGIETHICVSQTVNALIQKGFKVTVISDASSSRAEGEHLCGLDRIKEHGASVITTETALFEWLKTSEHPKFKEVQSLIK